MKPRRAAMLAAAIAVVALIATSCSYPFKIRMGLTRTSGADSIQIVFDDDEARPSEVWVTDAETDEIVWSVDTAQVDPQLPPTITIGQLPTGWTERTTFDGSLPARLVVRAGASAYYEYVPIEADLDDISTTEITTNWRNLTPACFYDGIDCPTERGLPYGLALRLIVVFLLIALPLIALAAYRTRYER